MSRSLGPARPRLAGSNVPWVHEGEALIDPNLRLREPLLALAREMAPTVLRYPGTPDTYHWRDGVGPLAQRPRVGASAGAAREQILLGTQEFLELCDELGAEPLIEVNLHDGTDESLAAEAAAWVKFTNRQTLVSRHTGRRLPAVRYWELGNEPYLMERTRPATGGGAEPNPLFLTPAQYTRRVNAVMAAMRAVDPTVRLGLPFATDTWSGRPWSRSPDAAHDDRASVVGPQLGYAQALLDGLAHPEQIGFLALHYYMPLLNDVRDAQGRRLPIPADNALYWAAMAGAESVRQHLAVVRRTWREHPRTRAVAQPPLIVTEFNAFFTDRHEGDREAPANAYIATQAGALFVADLLRMFAQEPDIEASLQWSLSRNWHFGAITFNDAATDFYGRPVFHVMRQLRAMLGGPAGKAGATAQPSTLLRPVDVQVAGTDQASRGLGFASPAAALPLATALATQTGKTLQLLVINKDPQRPAQVSVDLREAIAQKPSDPARLLSASAEIRSSSSANAFHAPGQPQASRAQTVALEVSTPSTPLTWRMPPASLAWVTIQLR